MNQIKKRQNLYICAYKYTCLMIEDNNDSTDWNLVKDKRPR